jgi:hypothetical protein
VAKQVIFGGLVGTHRKLRKKNGKQQGFESNNSKNQMQSANKAKKASKNVNRTLVTLHLYSTVNVWGSCCRGMCLFLQLVSHTCACTEGLGGSQRAGYMNTENALFVGGRDQKESKPPNYPYLTLCVSQLTLWEGGRWVRCVVYPQSSYMFDGGVNKIYNT